MNDQLKFIMELMVDKGASTKNITDSVKQMQSVVNKNGVKIKVTPVVDDTPLKKLNKEITTLNNAGMPVKKVTEFQTGIHQVTSEILKINKETNKLEATGSKVTNNYKASRIEAEKLSAAQEKLRKQAQFFAKSQASKLSSYVDKYSYSDTSELKRLQQELSRGGAFRTLEGIPQRIAMYEKQIASALTSAKKSHAENLAAINKEISSETNLQNLKDQFNRRNINAIDYEIKKREMAAMRFSNSLKSQMQAQANLIATQEKWNSTGVFNKQKLKNDFTTFLNDNPKILKYNSQEANNLLDSINAINNEASLKRARAEVNAFKSEISSLGQRGRTVFGELKNNLLKFTTWFALGTIIATTTRKIRELFTNVAKLDKEMTNLKKVTSESDTVYANFLDRTAKSAKKLGAEMSAVVSSTADFARLGYNMPDAEELAKNAVVYSNVGDIGIDQSTEALISIMKGFNIEASDSVKIIDKLNEVGNRFAISSGGIGEGLKRSASALALAGNSIDESIGLITAANTVIQNPSEAGNAVKILSMRLRGMKGKLEELGEDTEGAIDSISKIQTQIINRTGGKVNIFEDDGSFKSTYQIMKDISAVWKDISETDQADLLEIIAGKQRGNTIASIITQFADAEGALESSLNSVGSAAIENEKYLQSIEGKAKVLSATFQDLSRNTIDSGFVKGFIGLNTTLLEGVNKVGLFRIALTGLLAYMSSKAGRKHALLPQVA